ncbi:helix-turn-helix domain-containing protein [Salmonella enterica]|nr:hypothetical protein [Salmonella enterica]EDN6746553.1 hypothetical protein [Salmonella enterica]ELI0025936.1 helix-turn-helix domain-containing protein [Salmonella enterica]ELI0151733.1 helix-turn-helix domain-containing protein [Salmonella enterica]
MLIAETDYEQSVDTLGKSIMNHESGLELSFQSGQIIELPSNFRAIIYLKEGSAGIYYKENHCLVSENSSPAIIGLTFLFIQNYHMYIRFYSECKAYYINQTEFVKLCDKKQLWRHVSQLIARAERTLHSSPSISAFRNVYDVVKFHLDNIWKLPENERNNISIYKYILERSPISRSSLHKIIRDLNMGGYIKTERGKLLKLIRLPVKY